MAYKVEKVGRAPSNDGTVRPGERYGVVRVSDGRVMARHVLKADATEQAKALAEYDAERAAESGA